ncbi:MAG: 2-hydroxyglutaryl-CoA dehydratase, D-component [Methanocella sp. PtaU1.Bin125]|nr:MAG: 2-hydroxyglutaryl-CoA dehydratase, D-component [Methanocella sp. PtaU1.Bin125]
MAPRLKSLDLFNDAYAQRIEQLMQEKREGRKVIGTFCLYVPDEIIFAAGADRVVLCGGKSDPITRAEEYLPRSVCPLIKSSFGSVIQSTCGTGEACPHFGLVDAVVAEATCDGKKKMYELLGQRVPTYVIDLPQVPDSPGALRYFESELGRFADYLEGLTCIRATDDRLREEIRSANETRRLLQRLFDYRKRDVPPLTGLETLKVMQKQYFLSPAVFKDYVRALCEEIDRTESPAGERRPRIMIAGCPMPSGSTKVPEIIESHGGVIVVEESCTGTRSFEHLVDEERLVSEALPPMQAIAERYLKIPCACMTPNDRRIESIVDLAREYRVDGVVYYSLQGCHGYNVERYCVQQALKQAGISMLAIETDYSASDAGQIGLRVEAFLEMIA